MRHLLSILLLSAAIAAYAGPISPGEAQAIASDFFNSRPTSNINKATQLAIRAAVLKEDHGDQQPYYIFNAEGGSGFVIISGDDRARKILGYSDKGTFEFDHIPVGLRKLLSDYEKSIASIPDYAPTDASWKNYAPQDPSNNALVLKTANWGQFYPFNDLIPSTDDIKCPVGCSNTAQGILMRYYNWPIQGQGSVTYEWNGQILSADLSNTYNWNLIKDEYTGEELSTEEVDAIAVLMRDISFSNRTDFDLTGSGTSPQVDCLYENFNYAPKYRYFSRETYTHEKVLELAKQEIDKKHPLLVCSGSTPMGTGAHSYICDGYDGDFLHFNFGWEGYCNGYYSIDVSNSYVTGVDLNFTGGIEPNQDVAESDCLILSYFSNYDFEHTSDNHISCDISVMHGYFDKILYMGIAIENTESHTQYFQIVEEGKWNDVYDHAMSFINVNTQVPDGDYIIYPVIKLEGQNWERVSYNEFNQSYVKLMVENGAYHFSNPGVDLPIDEGKIEIDGIYYVLDRSNNTACVTYKNSRFKSYSGDIDIPSSFDYDGQTYIVNKIGTSAFKHSKLEHVNLPSTIETICTGAFECEFNSINLDEITDLITIEGWAFAGCEMEYLKLPENLKSIGQQALRFTTITYLELPSSLEFIGDMAFIGCSNLHTLKLNWTDEEKILSTYNAFPYSPVETIFIPQGTKALYSNIPEWNKFVLIEDDPIIASSIKLDKTEIEGSTGEKFKLTAILSPDNTTLKNVAFFIAESQNLNIVEVDKDGNGTFLRETGSTIITAKTIDGSNLIATCKVRCTGDALMGDADGNGIIDANDAVVMTNYYIGVIDENDIIIEVSDLNRDGVIDAQDALLVTNIYLGIGIE